MRRSALSREEAFGLAVAALGHVALVWVLVTAKPPEPLPPVDRVSVTLSDEMGAVSTSPNPQSDPMADKGPELGEPAPVEEAVPAPPVPKAVPQPPLAVVAPGISEALFATAIGLFAAIPAVIAYNRLSHRVDQLEARLQRFADRFHASLSRELDSM